MNFSRKAFQEIASCEREDYQDSLLRKEIFRKEQLYKTSIGYLSSIIGCHYNKFVKESKKGVDKIFMFQNYKNVQ